MAIMPSRVHLYARHGDQAAIVQVPNDAPIDPTTVWYSDDGEVRARRDADTDMYWHLGDGAVVIDPEVLAADSRPGLAWQHVLHRAPFLHQRFGVPPGAKHVAVRDNLSGNTVHIETPHAPVRALSTGSCPRSLALAFRGAIASLAS